MSGYLLLFVTAFAAATILPFYSELLVTGLQARGYAPLGLWLAASTGNTLGAAVNWWLGRFLLHYRDHRWFPVGERALQRAQTWFQRFGVWSLLLAWMPVGGDALTFVAGIMRVRLGIFLLLTFTGKALRYAIVILLADAMLAQ